MKLFLKMLYGILFYDKSLPYKSTLGSAKKLKGGKLRAPHWILWFQDCSKRWKEATFVYIFPTHSITIKIILFWSQTHPFYWSALVLSTWKRTRKSSSAEQHSGNWEARLYHNILVQHQARDKELEIHHWDCCPVQDYWWPHYEDWGWWFSMWGMKN